MFYLPAISRSKCNIFYTFTNFNHALGTFFDSSTSSLFNLCSLAYSLLHEESIQIFWLVAISI